MPRKDREAKRQRKTKIWMGAITIFVMISGGIGIFASNLGPGDNTLEYGDFIFEMTGNGWISNIDNNRLNFIYHPVEIDTLDINNKSIDLIKDADYLRLSYNPNSSLTLEISRIMDYFAIKFEEAQIYSERGFSVETEYDVSLFNCDVSTSEIPVILFEEGELNMELEGDCLIISAPDQDSFLRMTERILYSYYGVIDE